MDYETWRIDPAGAKTVRVTFSYEADTLDNAMSWTKPDFVLFNGTNLFLYPEGRGLNFPATVTVHTSPHWLVATGMAPGPTPGSFTAPTYHDLVDMPFFVGTLRSRQRASRRPMGAVRELSGGQRGAGRGARPCSRSWGR